MFHNYVVVTNSTTTNIAVDVGTAVNCTTVNTDPDHVVYYGTHSIYNNGKLLVKKADNFKITRSAIIMQWTSEVL